MKNILVAGASGFVGKALVNSLNKNYNVIALSRNLQSDKNAEWHHCDLLSYRDTIKSLQEAECAFYLAHALLPSTRLMQGNFWDSEVIMADNFIQGAKKNNIKKIVYLSCCMQEEKDVSRYQESRLELEEIFTNSGITTIVVRTSVITGGIIWEIVANCLNSKRSPVILNQTQIQPVSKETIVSTLIQCIDKSNSQIIHIFDSEKTSIENWIRTTIDSEVKKTTISVPDLTFSSIIKYTNSELVAENYSNALICQAIASEKKYRPRVYKTPLEKRVRSIQRLTLPQGKDADWVAGEYPRWLSQFMFYAMYVKPKNKKNYVIYARFFRIPLLQLTFLPEESEPDRHVLAIDGGIFTRKTEREARFEIRKIPGKQLILTAIHDFEPALPWYIYNATEALAHLWVMRSFGRHLKKI